MRQRAALEGAVLRTRHGTKFQLLSGQTTRSMLTAPVGQTFLDNDNPLYNANPADKVMDPDKPYLKGPFHAFAGDLVNPETVMISFVVTLNRETRVPDAIIPAAAVRRVRNRGILSRKLETIRLS